MSLVLSAEDLAADLELLRASFLPEEIEFGAADKNVRRLCWQRCMS